MTQVQHILWKDLRRLRWGIAGWLTLVGTRTFVNTAGANVALGGVGLQIGIDQVSALLSLISAVLLALLVSQLVHDEPLVGHDAFWMTRPIAPHALMMAKLAFATFFFVLAPLIGHVIFAATFGTGLANIGRAIPVFVLNQAIIVLVLMALAAVTPSTTRYAMAIVGLIAAFALLVASQLFLALLLTEEFSEGGDVGLPDPTRAVVGGTLLALTALTVIMYQYRRRRLGRALTIAAIGALVLFVVPQRWPWSFAARPSPELVAAPQDTPAITASLDGSSPRVSEEFTLRRRRAPRKQIALRAIVSGIPSAFNVRALVAQSQLQLPNGLVVPNHMQNSRGTLSTSGGGSLMGRELSVEAALGGMRLITRNATDAVSAEQWPTALRVSEEDFVRYRNEPGRLVASVDVLSDRAVARGVLPLSDGATTVINGMRVTIARIIRRATGCTVLLRRSYVEPLFSPPHYRDFIYVLRNATRGEAASTDAQQAIPQGGFANGFYLPEPHVGGRGFVLEQYELQFPPRRGPEGQFVDLNEAWLADSDFVVLEMVFAGRVIRTVTIDGFRMVP
jgi:hypothetical protein